MKTSTEEWKHPVFLLEESLVTEKILQQPRHARSGKFKTERRAKLLRQHQSSEFSKATRRSHGNEGEARDAGWLVGTYTVASASVTHLMALGSVPFQILWFGKLSSQLLKNTIYCILPTGTNYVALRFTIRTVTAQAKLVEVKAFSRKHLEAK